MSNAKKYFRTDLMMVNSRRHGFQDDCDLRLIVRAKAKKKPGTVERFDVRPLYVSFSNVILEKYKLTGKKVEMYRTNDGLRFYFEESPMGRTLSNVNVRGSFTINIQSKEAHNLDGEYIVHYDEDLKMPYVDLKIPEASVKKEG